MNKVLRLVVLVGTLMFLGAGAPAWAQTRIATVNLVEVFDNYWKTKQAKEAIKESSDDAKKEVSSMQDAHKKLIEAYKKAMAEANDQAVSADEREKRRKSLDAKLKELQDSETNLTNVASSRETELKVKSNRIMEDVVKDIRAVVAGKAKAAGYAMVFDSSARSMASTEVLLYNSGEADLTKPVIDELNISKPADTSK